MYGTVQNNGRWALQLNLSNGLTAQRVASANGVSAKSKTEIRQSLITREGGGSEGEGDPGGSFLSERRT